MSEEDRANSPGANAGSLASAATVAMRSDPYPRQSGPGSVSESAHVPVEATDDDPAEIIDRVFRQRDSTALRYFRRRLNLTVFAVALGPVAVLLLAIQIISFPKGGFFASILIASELVVLSVALAVGFLQMGRTHRVWIRERLRAEILRREGFLLRMRVGPYLKVAERALAEKVRERLVTLNSDVNDPVALLPLQDETESWRDALEDSKQDDTVNAIPDFATKLDTYLTLRTNSQREWFSLNSITLSKRARFYENGARSVLILALVIAAFHLVLLNAGQGDGFGHSLLVIIAIVAPTIGSAFVGLQSVSGSQRLSRSYTFYARELERFEILFRRVRAQLERSGIADDDLQYQFKRGVLGTEEILSSEMHTWWLIMHTEAPRAAA